MKKSAPLIEVCKLRVEREAVILDLIDWRVARGENWVILGANGSGKTSLLSVLTGYLAPTAGAIRVLGQTYGRSDWRELRRRVGLVSSSLLSLMEPDETALKTVISGRRAMLGLWGETSSREQTRGRRILRRVEAKNLAGRQWRFLSQGERQRILIGRALMAEPELMILDEPCAGLDPAAREHFVQFLQRLATRRGAPAMVLVTHHVEEVVPAFSHVLVLKAGRVLAAGPRTRMLKSALLSDAFGAGVTVHRRAGRYQLSIRPRPGAII